MVFNKFKKNKLVKIILLVLIIIIILKLLPIQVYARAGGGGGGSGGGGGGGSAGSSSGGSGYNSNPISNILGWIVFISITFSSAIVMKIKITKYRYNAAKEFKNTDWNYRELIKRVEKTYFILQKAWTKNDIKPAKSYLTKELYESYDSKLQWMEVSNKRNVLKKIRLLNVYPISVKDEKGNKNDIVYMYIKGKMVDYTINILTNEVIEGDNISRSFVEYWVFVKNHKNEWVLSKIYQHDELDNIPMYN
ncbi:MAG: Tim44 domain-containing protein [Bacilli bacterium]|nr:Tim44 domain-containing protein [Bacilli bacterium]